MQVLKRQSLLYQTRTSIDNSEIKNKLEESEIKMLNDLITETDTWLLDDKTKEEYENKLNEINEKINPIMMKVYQSGAGKDMPNMPDMSSMPGMSTEVPVEPTLDEVD